METKLANHLMRLAGTFSEATGVALATLGERAAGDWRFFTRVRDADLNFRVRTYDRAVAWFSANWPADLDWPVDVPRPTFPDGDAA